MQILKTELRPKCVISCKMRNKMLWTVRNVWERPHILPPADCCTAEQSKAGRNSFLSWKHIGSSQTGQMLLSAPARVKRHKTRSVWWMNIFTECNVKHLVTWPDRDDCHLVVNYSQTELFFTSIGFTMQVNTFSGQIIQRISWHLTGLNYNKTVTL